MKVFVLKSLIQSTWDFFPKVTTNLTINNL